MFFAFYLFVFSFLNASVDPLHSAPERYTLKVRSVKPFPRINIDLPWDGHFSAKNYKSSTEQLELKKVKKNIRKTILSLPKAHTAKLKTLEVRNKKHVSRGMANSKKMILHTGTIEDRKELSAVFIHEMGHVVDFGYLKGSAKSGRSDFRDGKKMIYNDDPSLDFYRLSWNAEKSKKRNALRRDFVSGYAMTDCFEDFAESYIFYRLHGEKFRLLAQKSPTLEAKYNFLKQRVFDGKEFQLSQEVTVTAKNLIWDTTLLDYESL